MDTNSLITIVGSLGFPIVFCIYLANYVKVLIKEFKQEIKEITALHKEESKEMATEIRNLRVAFQEFCEAKANKE